MRRKNKVLAYITAKKYYLSLICCLIITLIAVGIIYNKDQKYEEIANLNDGSKVQSLVENPDDLETAPINEAFDPVDSLPSIHQENIPEIVIEDAADLPVAIVEANEPLVIPDEILNEEPKEDEDGLLEEFVPVISVLQPKLTFVSAEGMTKPTIGDVFIAYSDDIPVYFKTLDQYKTSQGLYIKGDVGSEVKAVADGVVEKVDKGANQGYTILLYHGNGFKSFYAQLKEDMNIKEGDVVYKGDIIGYIEKPTNYYALEGPHLYFEVIENGKSIDPEPLFQ